MRSYKRLRKVVLGIHSVSLKLPVEYRVQGSSKVKYQYDKLTGDMRARQVYLIYFFDRPHLLLMEMHMCIMCVCVCVCVCVWVCGVVVWWCVCTI